MGSTLMLLLTGLARFFIQPSRRGSFKPNKDTLRALVMVMGMCGRVSVVVVVVVVVEVVLVAFVTAVVRLTAE